MAPVPQVYKLMRLQNTPSDWRLVENTKLDTDKGEKSLDYYSISYNGETLRFTLEVFGDRPANGYGFYISLHGGGKSGAQVNNGAWLFHATGGWRQTVAEEGGTIHASLRGIVDDWNLHFLPETFVLVSRLITDLLGPLQPSGQPGAAQGPLVNPNKVYLMGFSAGGDGVYRLATMMADRFAGVNMGGGHPGDISKEDGHNRVYFENLANLPICLQVGKDDNDYDLHRNDLTADAGSQIKDLGNNSPSNNYRYACFIHTGNGHRLLSGHSGWEEWQLANWQNQGWGYERTVISDIDSWRKDHSKDADVRKDTSTVHWFRDNAAVRNPCPEYVVWRLQSRPPAPTPADPRLIWKPQSFSYWLYLRKAAIVPGDKTILKASYNRGTKSVWINQPSESVGLLLNEKMLDFKDKIDFYTGDYAQQTLIGSLAANTIKPNESFKRATAGARRDKSFEFSAMVYFKPTQPSGTPKWEVHVAYSLEPPLKSRL